VSFELCRCHIVVTIPSNELSIWLRTPRRQTFARSGGQIGELVVREARSRAVRLDAAFVKGVAQSEAIVRTDQEAAWAPRTITLVLNASMTSPQERDAQSFERVVPGGASTNCPCSKRGVSNQAPKDRGCRCNVEPFFAMGVEVRAEQHVESTYKEWLERRVEGTYEKDNY
jgi:hypothetical protein